MGGSAQNTLLTCQKLSCKYQMSLAYGLSLESNMTDCESQSVEALLENARVKGVKTIAVPSLVRRINPVNDLRAMFDLIKIIRQEKPDIIHTHTSKAGIIGRLAAKISKVSYIVHTPHGHVFYGHFGLFLSRLFMQIERLFSPLTDRLIALTNGETKDYAELNVYPREKIAKIHSGVDIEKFGKIGNCAVAKKRCLGLDQKGAVVGFIGWLLPVKGPMHLLRAMRYVWQDYGDTNLVFVGKGDQDVDLRAEALNINQKGKVRFLGWRHDIEEIMQVFDIFVLPSLNEGMGRVLVEAMAAGKPVIASNVGGIPDLVKHDHNGLLVPPGDEKALADAINKLLDNPEKSKRMGQLGQQICGQFSLEAMAAKLDHLYQELAE